MVETEGSDYVFRYELSPETSGEEPVYHERLVEMLRAHLKNLLDLLVPLHNGQEVKIDGFKLLCDPATQYNLFEPGSAQKPETDGGAALHEPRITFIRQQLESLLRVVSLEKDGRVIEPDGFRLRDLKDWLVPSVCDPSEVYGYAATRCNANCIFCYNEGNPPQIALPDKTMSPDEEFAAIKTRIKYFSPRAKLALFPGLGSMYELLIHPYALETLRLLRQKTSKVFRIITNGLTLTPDIIDALAELKPVYLYVSLNSACPERHQRLMRSGSPDVVLKALPHLREKRIPYAIVIVAWLLDSIAATLDDLASTIAFCQPYEPHLFQINLPGYSGYFSDKKLFNLDEVWSAVVLKVRELRKTCSCPIVAMPTLYEENLCEERKNLPGVLGLVKNSPAARSGLMPGDRILEVNGLPVAIRPQARDILARQRESGTREVRLEVERAGKRLTITMNTDDFSYPYFKDMDPHFGIVFLGMGFRTSYIERLKGIIDSHGAKHVLFLSSRLVKPVFEQTLRECHILNDRSLTLDIEVPPNNFFGGNIFMGDLLVVQDFIDGIKEYLTRGKGKPDLIVIPSSPFHLSPWKRDLTGRCYLDIEREVGIPVELLEHEPIHE